MVKKFDPYAPLIGMSLLSVSFGRTWFGFEFHKPDQDVTHNIRLSTQADICLSEKELFAPFSEYKIVNPERIKNIFSALDGEVIDFKPLNKSRACRMDFENVSLYTWAGKNELPDCLYEARKNPESKDFEWWLIDDQ